MALGSIFQVSPCQQVVDKEMFLAGFDLNEDSPTTASDLFNATLGLNATSKVHTVELMGMQCGKECYAISVASVLTFLAGVYQVNSWILTLSPLGEAKSASFTSISLVIFEDINRDEGRGWIARNDLCC